MVVSQPGIDSRLSAIAYVAALVGALALTLWIYWPGLAGVAMLDDSANLGALDNLAGSPQLAVESIFGNQSGLLGRPVAMASFVVEKLVFQGDYATSKLVNICLHLLNGALLIYLLSALLRFADLPQGPWVALAAGGLWLLSPMQVSTVLYAVQRMAILSATFMLISAISYVRWRILVYRGRFVWYWPVLCVLSFLLAVFSKENGIVIVPVLWMMELLWFQCRSQSPSFEARLRKSLWISGAVGGVALLAVLAVTWQTIVEGYYSRDFSLPERLLTEARILWDYAGQFLWPELSRLGLYHDDTVISRSLTEPLSTVFAVLAWGLAILLVVLSTIVGKGRYLAFGLAFYLAAHSLESTLWPLELYFEHRNYFPGVGLVLFLAVLISTVISKWPEVSRPVLVYTALFVLLLAGKTSSQVQIWSNSTLLVFNHVIGHPASYRANADMAMLVSSQGDLVTAERYFERARKTGRTQSVGDHIVLDVILHCLANKDFSAQTRFDESGSGEALKVNTPATLLTLLELIRDDQCPSMDVNRFADAMARVYLAENVRAVSHKVYFALAAIENKLQRYDLAYAYTERFLQLRPNDVTALLMKLHFATALRRESVVDATVARLKKLDRSGGLTAGERETLQLYLD